VAAGGGTQSGKHPVVEAGHAPHHLLAASGTRIWGWDEAVVVANPHPSLRKDDKAASDA
jgi:hypothetical protein